jgi:hypothetical protein
MPGPEVISGTLVGNPYQSCAQLQTANGVTYLSQGVPTPGFSEGDSVRITFEGKQPRNCNGPTIKVVGIEHAN